MLGNEFSSYPQGSSARDALDCDIEAFLNNWRVISKSKLCGFLAKVALTTDGGVPEERMVKLNKLLMQLTLCSVFAQRCSAQL